MAKRARQPLPDVIKAAARATGMSVNALAHAAGVQQAALHRFLNGQRGINLDTAEKLCAYLGLELLPAQRGKGGAPAACS